MNSRAIFVEELVEPHRHLLLSRRVGGVTIYIVQKNARRKKNVDKRLRNFQYRLMSIDDTLERIRAYRKAYSLSYRELAILAGVAKNTVRGMDEPGWAPSVTTVRKIEAAMERGRPNVGPAS